MKMNRRMKELLRTHPRYLDAHLSEDALPPALQAILSAGIARSKGGFFLKALLPKGGNACLEDFPDMTGYECFINHVHLEDHITTALLKSGIQFGSLIRQQLMAHAVDGNKFTVIVSCSKDGCSVRFHLNRPNEAWLSEKLDAYAEALLVLGTDDKARLDD